MRAIQSYEHLENAAYIHASMVAVMAVVVTSTENMEVTRIRPIEAATLLPFVCLFMRLRRTSHQRTSFCDDLANHRNGGLLLGKNRLSCEGVEPAVALSGGGNCGLLKSGGMNLRGWAQNRRVDRQSALLRLGRGTH